MTVARFERPMPGQATPVRFPAITRAALPNGLALWTIGHTTVPAFTATLLLPRGTVDDPPDRPGLASLTGDLVDEGAGSRDALQLAEAFAQMGTQIEVEVGPDACSISVTALVRFLGPALHLMADVVMRPRLQAPDFARVRELRLTRLRQLSRSASTIADRAYISAVFDTHAYGHGALGQTSALEAVTLDETREFWRRAFGPRGATLSIVGDVTASDVSRTAAHIFAEWTGSGDDLEPAAAPRVRSDPRILLVDKPGAAQSELRIGHLGPPRDTPAYHALVVLNAVLGGQFTSRINRRLREDKGVTYGARTSFDFRRLAGTLSCETSVQGNATASSAADILEEFGTIGREPVPDEELSRARASLTRGYVRNFETAGQVARAAGQLAIYGLGDDVFDDFVPTVEAMTAAEVHAAAATHVRPAEATIVVVGDAATCRESLEKLDRPVVLYTPEF
ncbi:MAG: pitrilysin family protein [Vicinamibacterales bacterium]